MSGRNAYKKQRAENQDTGGEHQTRTEEEKGAKE